MADSYDVIVLGAGPTGENVAARAVRGGLTAVVVESELVGGECSYWACMPSKGLLRPIAAVSEASHVGGADGARLDPPAVLARRDSFAHDWKDDGQVEWLKNAGIDLVRGPGRITGDRVVKVGDTELRARHAVVVATGTRALVPAPLAAVNPWTSREATSAHAVPGSLAIVGGGVVACEMAVAWQALGARVTLLARGGLLERLPGFAGDLVAEGLRGAGVDVRLRVSVTSASRGAAAPSGLRSEGASREPKGAPLSGLRSEGAERLSDEGRQRAKAPGGERDKQRGAVTLTLDDGTTLTADELLAATGRAPRTEDIGLEAVGLAPGSWLEVDDTMRVRAVGGKQGADGWLYAAGDVNRLALLTHMGKYQGRICGDAIAARVKGSEPAVTDRSSVTCIPQVVFTIPEVAAVGLTAEQAEAAGHAVRVVEYEIGNVAGARLFADGYTGHAQMVVDENSKRILGVTLAGPGVGEMIHAATVAVAGEVPLDRLWHAVPSYPTMSELWLRLLEAYGL
jgi:pyruvate/2-oxoglutarate dehydrogenase complex dihydrolipoamide dehydrogenase (E3) component